MIEPELKTVAKWVETRLDQLFREKGAQPRSNLFAAPPESELLIQVRDLTLRAGKRVRPALLAYGAMLFEAGALDNPAVLDAAAAIELLHAYFLIHDDIMDDDAMRRGSPSVHAALSDVKGDSKLGRDLAILSGDLAVALHEGLLANLPTPDNRRRTVARIFAEMHLDVVHGQTLDLLGSGDATEVAQRKTASYTTVGPLTCGAALGGADDGDLKLLADIGRPLGIAFQITDDLLGVFGHAHKTGKSVGTDLKNGKRTLLLEEALARAGDEERFALEQVLRNEAASDEAMAEATRALVTCGAKRACQQRVEELVSGALRALDVAPFREEGKRLLAELARFLVQRQV